MKYFYGVCGTTQDPLKVFTVKCKTYAVMEQTARTQYNLPEGTEIHFLEITKLAHTMANNVFSMVEQHPYVKGYFSEMLAGLNQAIDKEESTDEFVENTFEAMGIMLKVISKYMIKSIVGGKEDYISALNNLKRDKSENPIERGIINILIKLYSEKLNILNTASNTIVIT